MPSTARVLSLAAIPPAGLSGNGFDPTIFGIVMASIIIPMLVIVPLALWAYRRQKRNHELNVRTGVAATARVVLLERQPGRDCYRLTLEVRAPPGMTDGQPFVAVVLAGLPLPLVPLVQVGSIVPIRMASKSNIELTLPGAA